MYIENIFKLDHLCPNNFENHSVKYH